MIRAAIHGRLGADPVPRETRTGKPMTTVSVAVDVSKPGDDPVTEWIGVVAFGLTGEALAQHARGDLIEVMGPLTRSTFQGRDGEEQSRWNLLAESLLSARMTYDRPCDGVPARPRRARAPNRSYSRLRQAGQPSIPDDRVNDLYVDIVP
jgi:single-strand DNA-binding protein